MFVITENWVHAHKSKAGGWTMKQLEAIGVDWPPRRGWIERAIGRKISDAARRTFEVSAKKRKSDVNPSPLFGDGSDFLDPLR